MYHLVYCGPILCKFSRPAQSHGNIKNDPNVLCKVLDSDVDEDQTIYSQVIIQSLSGESNDKKALCKRDVMDADCSIGVLQSLCT